MNLSVSRPRFNEMSRDDLSVLCQLEDATNVGAVKVANSKSGEAAAKRQASWRGNGI